MRTFFWAIFFGYFIISLYIKKFFYNIAKRKMSEEEIERYAQVTVAKIARYLMIKSRSTVELEGLENLPEGACLFVSNHQGLFDIIAVTGYINKPLGFIAKKELAKLPGVNLWMKEMQCIFLDRENTRESLKTFAEGVQLLKKGHSMVIFPEGTRSKGPEMDEFKKGSMKLATKAGVPIVPISIDGTYHILEEQNYRDVKPAKVKMMIAPPIETQGMSKEEQNVLSDRVRDIIESNLKKIQK